MNAARPTIRRRPAIAALLLAATLAAAGSVNLGCRTSRPLEPAPVPRAGDGRLQQSDPTKPLPESSRYQPGYPNGDAPLDVAPPPEAGPFVSAYDAVGRPKIVVFVNRTLEGAVVPTTRERILSGRRRVIETDGPVDATRTQSRQSYDDNGNYYGGRSRGSSGTAEERFTTTGPTRLEDRTETYLAPGEYDEIAAKRIDYAGLENALADALGVRGEVTILSPSVVRQRLSLDEVRALQQGRPAVLDGLRQRLGADVLVQVQAHPTAQTDRGLALAIVAEAMNTDGAESIGRANASFDGPMSAYRLDAVSRYLSRRLMDDMTGAWLTPVPPPATQPQ